MKVLKNTIGILSLSAMMMLSSCGGTSQSDEEADAASASGDSSATKSTSDIGVGSGNQKEVPGFPSNQSNLNSDSLSKHHDDDTTSNKKRLKK